MIDDTPSAGKNLPDRFLECTCGQEAPKTGMPAGIGELASAPSGVKKLDGPLDPARFTLKPVDPQSLSESRRRATLARFGIDLHLNEQGDADRGRGTLDERPLASLRLRTRRGED
ncbi:hypothetical protein SB861_28535 [Paraburkholderia sp. SIMBA_049]